MLAFLGVFFTTFFGIFILDKLDKRDIKEYILLYPVLTVVSNLINIGIFRLIYGYIEDFGNRLNIDVSYLMRYCIISFFIQIVLIIFYIIADKLLVFKLRVTDEKGKNSK